MTVLRIVAVVVGVLLVGVPPGVAQVESAELSDDLRGIRVALEKLVELQENERFHTRVDILLKRIELHERRMEPLQNRLNTTESEIDKIQKNLKALEGMLEQHDTRLEEEVKEGVDSPRSETRRMLDDLRRTMKANNERLEELVARARRLEDELAESAEDIEDLDDKLAELLGTDD